MLKKILYITLSLSLMLIITPLAGAQGCNGVSYTVVTGDTLSSIAARFGVSVEAIANANGITNPNLIYIAQALCIPNAGAGGAGAPGTGGPVTSTSGGGGGVNTVTVAAETVWANGGRTQVRLANSQMVVVSAGTADPDSDFSTTATVGLDALNNVIHVSSDGMIPLSYAAVYISIELGDRSGGALASLKADDTGHVEGYIVIPDLFQGEHQYVMLRAWDGRMTWGYFDLPMSRFP